MKKKIEIDDKLLEKIISVAYGDAKFSDKIEIYRLSKIDSNVKKILNGFKETVVQLSSIRNENCPEEIINKVYSETGIANRKSSLNERIQFIIFSKPVYAAASVLILMTTLLFLVFRQPEPQQKYSKAEVEKAELQVKQTLVFVGGIFKKTGENLEDNILPDEVGKPFNKGLNTVKNILNGG